MARSINKVIIVGNLTRDPEMKYTPSGQAVVTFGVATSRRWTTNGEQKEETEFHNVVAWGKLAEICNQLLQKGRKVYIEGRLRTRNWEDKNAVKHYRTEIIALDMVVLDRREVAGAAGEEFVPPEETPEESAGEASPERQEDTSKGDEAKKKGSKGSKEEKPDDIQLEEIPF